MKVVRVAAQYLQHLLRLWLYWFLFPMLDLAIFVSDYLLPTLSVPPFAYWALLIMGFLLANVKLFAGQQDRISELESTQADIRLTLRKSGFDHSHSGRRPPFPDARKPGPYGFDQHGMPGWAVLWATLEIENVGYESGELVLRVMQPRTELPGLFAVDEGNNGWFPGGFLGTVDARTRLTVQWCLHIRITQQEPEAFARELRHLGKYGLVMQYHTRRIGGESDRSILVLKGDLSDFRRKVLKYWKGSGFSHLVQLAESDC